MVLFFIGTWLYMYVKFVKCVPQNIWRSQDIFRCSSLPSVLLRLTSGSFVVDKSIPHSLPASLWGVLSSFPSCWWHDRITDVCSHINFLHGFWGSKLHSSNFHGKHFIHWTISTAPHWFFLPQSCHSNPTPRYFSLFIWPDPSLRYPFKYHVFREVFTHHCLLLSHGFTYNI